MYIRRLALIMMLALWGGAGTAEATVQNMKSFKQAYPELKKVSCQVCHENKIGRKGDLNAYGEAMVEFKAPEHAKKLAVEDYQAIEADDADADGASNLDELTAGSDPSDPASLPEGFEPAASAVDGVSRSRQTPVLQELYRSVGNWLAPPAIAAEEPADANATSDYVGSETCTACHMKQAREFKLSTHSRISIPEAEVHGCEMCHGPGRLHVEAGGGRGVGGMINPDKEPSACFKCHLDKKMQFRLTHHHPVLEGKMNCSDCHSAHGAEVRPWTATSLKDINEACFKCHKEQRGPFVWEHEALREGCTTCHKVHGSIHDKMLIAADSNLCLRCHVQTNFPRIGDSNHASRLPEATCFAAGCHTAVHGSNFDDHLRY